VLFAERHVLLHGLLDYSVEDAHAAALDRSLAYFEFFLHDRDALAVR
jgi:hypothetical protein